MLAQALLRSFTVKGVHYLFVPEDEHSARRNQAVVRVGSLRCHPESVLLLAEHIKLAKGGPGCGCHISLGELTLVVKAQLKFLEVSAVVKRYILIRCVEPSDLVAGPGIHEVISHRLRTVVGQVVEFTRRSPSEVCTLHKVWAQVGELVVNPALIEERKLQLPIVSVRQHHVGRVEVKVSVNPGRFRVVEVGGNALNDHSLVCVAVDARGVLHPQVVKAVALEFVRAPTQVLQEVLVGGAHEH